MGAVESPAVCSPHRLHTCSTGVCSSRTGCCERSLDKDELRRERALIRRQNAVSYQISTKISEEGPNMEDLDPGIPLFRAAGVGSRSGWSWRQLFRVPSNPPNSPRGSAQAAGVTGSGFLDQLVEQEVQRMELKRTGRSKKEAAQLELRKGAAIADSRRVRQALRDGADVNAKDLRGATPLMLAVIAMGKDAKDVVRELLTQKAEAALCDDNGWVALHHAVRHAKVEIAKCLIQHEGVDLSLNPKSQILGGHVGQQTWGRKTKDAKTILMLAILEGSEEMVRLLFHRKVAKPLLYEKDSEGMTVLHLSVKHGNHPITRLLLDRGSKVNARDNFQKTPLMVAAENNHLGCGKLLGKKHAEINSQDKRKQTPLMHCILQGHESFAIWLLTEARADPDMHDWQKETPMQMAEEMNMKRVVRFIYSGDLEEFAVDDGDEPKEEKKGKRDPWDFD